MEILHHVFGGKTRIRIMRLFLLNPDKCYDEKSAVSRSRGTEREVERELASFEKIGLIKRRRIVTESKKKRVRIFGWVLNNSFVYLKELRSLLLNDVLMTGNEILQRLSRGGSLKLLVLAGIFIQDWDSRVDLLIVGDKLKKGVLERTLRSMEAEIGRELRYTILDLGDFNYRMSIGDRLVRDIFDYPHQIVLDRGILG